MRFTPLLIALVLAACDATGPEADTAAARPEKVPVCHYDAATDSFSKILLVEQAVPAHLAHGDARPGDPVPAMQGFAYDDACEPAPIELTACYVWGSNAYDLIIASPTGDITGVYEPGSGVAVFDLTGAVTDPAGYVPSVADVDALEFHAAIRTPTPTFIDFFDVAITRQTGDTFAGTFTRPGGEELQTSGPLTAGSCPTAEAEALSETTSRASLRSE